MALENLADREFVKRSLLRVVAGTRRAGVVVGKFQAQIRIAEHGLALQMVVWGQVWRSVINSSNE